MIKSLFFLLCRFEISEYVLYILFERTFQNTNNIVRQTITGIFNLIHKFASILIIFLQGPSVCKTKYVNQN